MKKLISIIFSILLVQSGIGQAGNDWPVFRGDPALTGITSNRLPGLPKLLWSFQAGDDLRSSPVSGSGRIVAGSMDGTVYCLDKG